MNSSSTEEDSPLLRQYLIPSVSEVSPVIREDDDAITIRRPLQYHSINRPPQSHANETRAAINRYRYYNRLAPHRESILLMPNHVVPADYFLILPFKSTAGNQSSIVTIFSIWNTMVGTSILTMPWVLERAGFGCGIGLMIFMAGLMLYTAYRVMKSPQRAGLDTGPLSGIEFSDVCRHYLGRWGEYISIVFSLITLLGAAVVYWVLMTNFLYNSVLFIYDEVTHSFNSSATPLTNISRPDVYCLHPPTIPHNLTTHDKEALHWGTDMPDLSSSHDTLFRKIWVQNKTVPFFLILVIGPIINMKSPTFFTKFNALGTVSIFYILTLVAIKGGQWGINMKFDPSSLLYIPEFQWSFPALTGTLSLAMFIHNCLLSIVRNQRHPEKNGRDLSIAYVCVTVTYMFVGIVFYICFPLPKSCIEDNLLNNFHSSNILAFTARIFLFFQMITVFPLLVYIFRIQVFNVIFNNIYPGLLHVILLNIFLMGIAVVFAVFLPKIGQIISFSGALCGLVYVFTLPGLVYMLSLKAENKLRWPMLLAHSIIILLGTLNFVAQFLISHS